MQDLDTRERQIVQNIFHTAESKFNEEIEINPGTTFSLIRLLSAYNDILPQYGLSSVTQSRIYNHLVSISKRYNPSSQQQWNIALSKASSISPLQIKDRLSHRRKTYNTPVSQFINESIDNSKISLNSKSRSRMSIKNIDKKHMLIHRNMSRDQIKQYDDCGEVFRKDYSKFDTTQNLTLSRDRMKTLLSFPTCNTQDSVEVYEDCEEEERREEGRMMEVRAEMFYRINTYSKVFLIIKASMMVKQELKMQELRMQKRVEKIRVKANFIKLFKIVEQTKTRQQKNKVSLKFYNNKLKRKIMKCLKVLKQLSVSPHKEQSPNLLNNNIALHFVFNLLCSSMDQESKQKLELFWKEKKYKQLETLVKMFNKHSFVKCQMFGLIQNHLNKNTKSKIFEVLKLNRSKHNAQLLSLANIQKQQVFQKLTLSAKNKKQFRIKQQQCRKKVVKKILTNNFWFWKKCSLSNKRNNIIQKHLNTIYEGQLKKGIWRMLTKQLTIQKQISRAKQQSYHKIQSQYQLNQLSKYFYALKKNYLLNKKQILQSQKAEIFRRKKLVLTSFQSFIKNTLCSKQQKCLNSLFEQNKKSQLSTIFMKWKKAASAKMMLKAFKKVKLRSIFWLICESVLEEKVEKRNSAYSDNFYKNMIWRRFVRQTENSKLERQNRMVNLIKILKRRRIVEYFSRIKANIKTNIKLKRCQITIEGKSLEISAKLRNKFVLDSFIKMKTITCKSLQRKNKVDEITNIRKKDVFTKLSNNFKEKSKMKQLKHLTTKVILKIHFSKFKKFLKTQQQNKSKLYQVTQFTHLRNKKQQLTSFKALKRFYQIVKCIQIKANLHYQLKLLSYVFVGFKNNSMVEKGIEQVCTRNIRKIINSRKNKLFKQMKCIVKKQIQLKHQTKTLNRFLALNKQIKFVNNLRNQQLVKQVQNQNNSKLSKVVKKIFISRLSRVEELRPINIEYLMKKIWVQRFMKNVNQKMIKRKMNEMALLHYMQTILGKSIKMLKYTRLHKLIDNQ